MKESVAIAKDADTKKGFSPTRSDKSIHRVRNESERHFGSLRSVIDSIRRNGGTPSVESIATELSGMHSAQRAPALLALQRTHGNRYVQRVVSGIQAKLKIGQPGDMYEREADRVADAVMRMPEPEVQRQAEEEEKKKEEEKLIQTKPLSAQITPLVQRQAEEKEEEEEEEILQTRENPGQTPEVTPDFESRIQSLKGGGQSLPEANRGFMERRFGIDFSGVRVHTDSDAAEINRVLNAEAFTHGMDIYFGAGRYNPSTLSGRKLLSHELTHVIQQSLFQRSVRNHAERLLLNTHTKASEILLQNYTPVAGCENMDHGFLQMERDPSSAPQSSDWGPPPPQAIPVSQGRPVTWSDLGLREGDDISNTIIGVYGSVGNRTWDIEPRQGRERLPELLRPIYRNNLRYDSVRRRFFIVDNSGQQWNLVNPNRLEPFSPPTPESYGLPSGEPRPVIYLYDHNTRWDWEPGGSEHPYALGRIYQWHYDSDTGQVYILRDGNRLNLLRDGRVEVHGPHQP